MLVGEDDRLLDELADAPQRRLRRQRVEADLGGGLDELLDAAGTEVDRDVGEPDREAEQRGLEAQLERDREEQDQLGQERRQRVGLIRRVVRERLRGDDRRQRQQRRAAADSRSRSPSPG